MIQKILHIIWNERHNNTWLMLEIIAASIMLWLAIDPLITLKRLDNIDDGYDLTGTYAVNMEKYKPYHPKYEWENNSDSVVAENFMNLYAIVRSLPEVESYCFTSRFSGSPGDNSAMMYGPVHKEIISNEELTHEKANDKGTYFSGYLSFNIDGSDIFKTFGIKDALTGKIFTPRKNDTDKNIYISESAAEKYFGSAQEAIGKHLYLSNSRMTISGIINNIQAVDYKEHGLHCILPQNTLISYIVDFRLHIRLKKGTDAHTFEKKFRQEIAPTLTSGNVHFESILSNKAIRDLQNEARGIFIKIRLYTAMALFSLFTVFLGTLSAFWIRTSARKGEIGIMRSIGASRLTIVKQFVIETSLIVNIGFGAAIIFVLHYLHINGFADPMKNNPLEGIKLMQFAVVTAISYAIVMTTAICSAAIPVWRITKILPADALRE